jgi:hypothetical protein
MDVRDVRDCSRYFANIARHSGMSRAWSEPSSYVHSYAITFNIDVVTIQTFSEYLTIVPCVLCIEGLFGGAGPSAYYPLVSHTKQYLSVSSTLQESDTGDSRCKFKAPVFRYNSILLTRFLLPVGSLLSFGSLLPY